MKGGAQQYSLLKISVATADIRLTGLALKTTPNRSMSYLEANACIISMAQHAKPKVIGHREPCKREVITEGKSS